MDYDGFNRVSWFNDLINREYMVLIWFNLMINEGLTCFHIISYFFESRWLFDMVLLWLNDAFYGGLMRILSRTWV